MFRKKDAQQIIEQANQISTQAEQYQKVLEQVEQLATEGRLELDQIGISNNCQKNCYTKLAEFVKQTKENSEQGQENIALLLGQIKILFEKEQTSVALLDDYYQNHHKLYESLCDMMEQSKHFSGSTKHLQQEVGTYQAINEKMSQNLQQMKEYNHNMSALALQSAIEAGRMGDVGKQYLITAQEISDYVTECEQKLEEVVSVNEEMSQTYQKTQQELNQLIQLLKQQNVMLQQLAKTTKSDHSKMKTGEDISLEQELIELNGQLQKNQSILGQMTSVGEAMEQQIKEVSKYYLEGQTSSENLDSIFDSIKTELSDLEYINYEIKY